MPLRAPCRRMTSLLAAGLRAGLGLALVAILLAASAPAQADPLCTVWLPNQRGLLAVGCQAPGVSGWVAVAYDCWVVGAGQQVGSVGTGAYGVSHRVVLPLVGGSGC